ncbi:MAG: hypothetical protein ACOYMN_07745 [Roseimicrobium sp.]
MATSSDEDGGNERPSDSPSAFDYVERTDLNREEQAAVEFAENAAGVSITAVRPHGWTGGSGGSGVDQKTPASTFAARGRFDGALKAVFGKSVLFVRPKSADVYLPFAGINPGTSRNVLVVNAESRQPLLWLAGHEFGHALKAQNRALYEAVQRVILLLGNCF